MNLFTFVEVALVQYSRMTGLLLGVTIGAANTKVKRKKANKVEVLQAESPREEPQANAKEQRTMPPTPPKQSATLRRQTGKPSGQGGRSAGRGKTGKQEKRNQKCIPVFRGN